MMDARLSRLMPILILFGLGVAYALFFMRHPDADLMITRHAWNESEGFFLKETWWAMAIYKHIIPWITRTTIILGIIMLLIKWKFPHRIPRAGKREIFFILLCLAIGPGLVVNTVFKDNWHRARPAQVQEFGGTKIYSPPLYISDQCEKNCSFVAGHPSVAFFLAAFALLIRNRKNRIAAYTASVLFGLFVGYVRIVQGGHFFSDVVFSGIFTLLVVHSIHLVMFGKEIPSRATHPG